MIQLLPVTEQVMLERLNRIYQQNAQFAYVCVEKREIKASCLYNIKGDVGEILKMVRWKNSVASSIMKKSIVDMDIHVKEKRRNSNES